MAVVSRKLIIAAAIMLPGAAAWGQPGDDGLPPPPDAQSINQQAEFHLALVINYYDTQQVVPVTRRR